MLLLLLLGRVSLVPKLLESVLQFRDTKILGLSGMISSLSGWVGHGIY